MAVSKNDDYAAPKPRKLLEWHGKVLPAGWEERPDQRKWYRYQIGQNPNELLRLLVGQDRGGWRWKSEVRTPSDQEWHLLGGSTELFPRHQLARRAADESQPPPEDRQEY